MVEIKVEDPLRTKIRKVVVKNKVVKPEYYDSLTDDLTLWAHINKRDMTMDEMNAMLKKYQ